MNDKMAGPDHSAMTQAPENADAMLLVLCCRVGAAAAEAQLHLGGGAQAGQQQQGEQVRAQAVGRHVQLNAIPRLLPLSCASGH